ncbi:MAG: glycosyl hydrolase family 95 catalytic domain-containing protein, partial [Verrucomicrobiota bacterium]
SLTALSPDFDRLLARHAKVHGELFNRVRLDLGGAADRGLTSEELIAASKVGRTSPALLEKEFDAARYAVISSSGELYPNLQGIWNGTWSPPWSSDFTQNGNVQTAIAADLDGNLAECLLPYLRYVESQVPQYRENAWRLYGCRGIHLPSRTSTHGLNNHFDSTWPMTFWTAGAGWAAHFFYDYYLHTGDREFLREHALPFMKEAALFYENFLVTGPDGNYLFSPSYSPENNPANSPSQACINATMDISVAKELLRNCIAACQTLDIDPGKVRQWQAMLARMPEYQINADGALKEWTTPLLEDNYAHRHASHLYALFDGLPEEIATNAPLRKAFQVAIEKRMEHRRHEPNGEMAFGAVQLGLAAASLGQAETCREVIDWLANLYWTPALTSTHNAHSIFNTDICGGLPAVVIKMLVASAPGRIDLLPALPGAWPKGKIEGVRCRGQIEVKELAWDGTRVSVTLNSANRQMMQLNLPGGIQSVKVVRGRADVADRETSSSPCRINLPAGKDVTLEMQRGRWAGSMADQDGARGTAANNL